MLHSPILMKFGQQVQNKLFLNPTYYIEIQQFICDELLSRFFVFVVSSIQYSKNIILEIVVLEKFQNLACQYFHSCFPCILCWYQKLQIFLTPSCTAINGAVNFCLHICTNLNKILLDHLCLWNSNKQLFTMYDMNNLKILLFQTYEGTFSIFNVVIFH